MPITFSGVTICECCLRTIPFRESCLFAFLVGAFGDKQMVILCWGCDGQNSFVDRFGVTPEIRR